MGFPDLLVRAKLVMNNSYFATLLVVIHLCIAALFSIVLIAGYALSAWMAGMWAMYVWNNVIWYDEFAFETVVYELLRSVEILLLMPLPAVAATVTFRHITKFSDPHTDEQKLTEQEMTMAKRFLLGILATVAGTTMLGELLKGDDRDILYFASGALLILTVTLFIYVAQRSEES